MTLVYATAYEGTALVREVEVQEVIGEHHRGALLRKIESQEVNGDTLAIASCLPTFLCEAQEDAVSLLDEIEAEMVIAGILPTIVLPAATHLRVTQEDGNQVV
eukprot:CCRYP_005865-RA/>CCRYP_005865-RA protein AED:0.23 eAED:0.23 QI:0/-1/0/1/-1/1/1/0/102